MTSNILVGYLLVRMNDFDLAKNISILGVTILITFLLIFRLVPAMLYLIKYNLIKYCGRKFSSQYINSNLDNGNRILNALKVIELKIK